MSFERLYTVAVKPFFMACSHIHRPITPVPIQPILVVPAAAF